MRNKIAGTIAACKVYRELWILKATLGSENMENAVFFLFFFFFVSRNRIFHIFLCLDRGHELRVWHDLKKVMQLLNFVKRSKMELTN